ncbi:hypothetical protein D1007_43243 [Hordeum vulgare]|nr:hypothetical protein D1007_43243 [Hordeum vulgare]
MPSWKEEESSDEDICMVSMDEQFFETPDTAVDPSFYGSFPESEPTCMMHHERPKKMDEGVNCGVVEWVDAPCPDILQRCLGRLWEMYQEQNFGRVKDQQAHDKEAINKKKKELEDHARIEISMGKLKLAKEQRCILKSQAVIIQNMRKSMKEVKVDRDLLKEEKKKLEYLIADLLKAGPCTKEKLERIKAIVDE